jgi:hypothetical protein
VIFVAVDLFTLPVDLLLNNRFADEGILAHAVSISECCCCVDESIFLTYFKSLVDAYRYCLSLLPIAFLGLSISIDIVYLMIRVGTVGLLW